MAHYIRPNETIIKTARGGFGRPYYLLSVAEGIEIAGSGTRHQHACYRVASFDRDDTRHSQAFKTLAEAEAHFAAYTTPIVAIDA